MKKQKRNIAHPLHTLLWWRLTLFYMYSYRTIKKGEDFRNGATHHTAEMKTKKKKESLTAKI